MTRRTIILDPLREVRRAMRILRRVELHYMQELRHAKRLAEKRADRETADLARHERDRAQAAGK